MATGGRLSRSKIHASDQIIDFPCTPCVKKNKSNESVKYCPECQEYLCAFCVENHNSFSALAGHSLLDSGQFGSSGGKGRGRFPAVPTDRCNQHATKLVDMYCGNHDNVGCSVCFSTRHRSCDDIHYVPEYVQSRKLSSQFSKIQKQIEKRIDEIKAVAKRQHKSRDDLSKRKGQCLQDIRNFRTEINKTVDRLEESTIKDIDDQHNALEKQLDDELKAIQNSLDELRRLKASVESSNTNISQQFVSAKLGEALVKEAKELISGSLNISDTRLQFVHNSEILAFLKNQSSLMKKEAVLSLSSEQRGKYLYKLKEKTKVNIRSPSDKNTCDILSMCMLDSDRILIADNNNMKLKILNSNTSEMKSELSLDSPPCGVCTISQNEVAVALDNTKIQFVAVQDGLKPTRTLNMNHACWDICLVSNKLYITGGANGNIYIHDMNGMLEKTISPNVISFTDRIVGSDDGNAIFVTNLDKGLIKLDRNGALIWKCPENNIGEAFDVCTDGHGNAFVSDRDWSVIGQVSAEGRFVGEVISKDHCLDSPKGLCFDMKRSKLFVGGRNDYVHIYTLQ